MMMMMMMLMMMMIMMIMMRIFKNLTISKSCCKKCMSFSVDAGEV